MAVVAVTVHTLECLQCFSSADLAQLLQKGHIEAQQLLEHLRRHVGEPTNCCWLSWPWWLHDRL